MRGVIVNPVSMAGGTLAGCSLLALLFLLILEILGGIHNPYIGVLAYLILPGLLVIGLLLVPTGVAMERRRLRSIGRLETTKPFPVLDLNDPTQRRVVTFFGASTVVILVTLGVVTYEAAEFMDSTVFCGQVCHAVMIPEFTAYQTSPHARVNCVHCHIGPGADWMVKSKISGARQVFAYLLSTYPRPIPTPIENLRPARETCERCHWPDKFYSDRLLNLVRFEANAANTRRDILLVMKTGGGTERKGLSMGIHWHIQNEVWYVAADHRRQVIPWVQVIDRSGNITEYVSTENPLSAEELARRETRRMDCIDCHNRATHIFPSAEKAIDEALADGRIDPSLPFIKKWAMETLMAARERGPTPAGDAFLPTAYAGEEAIQWIANELPAKYRGEYPDLYEKKWDSIAQAAKALGEIYRTIVFPEMRADWLAYPDNAQHRESPGCFRCHDGKHVSKSGQVVRLECNLCHSIPRDARAGVPLGQVLAMPEPPSHLTPRWTLEHGKEDRSTCRSCHQPGGPADCANAACHGRDWLGRPFQHPVKLEGKHAQIDCAACHNRPDAPRWDCKLCHQPPPAHFGDDCEQCHQPGGQFRMLGARR